jgi:hypothetical protein
MVTYSVQARGHGRIDSRSALASVTAAAVGVRLLCGLRS